MNKQLALCALGEARKNYHGNTPAAIGNLQPIAELFAGEAEENVDVLDLVVVFPQPEGPSRVINSWSLM